MVFWLRTYLSGLLTLKISSYLTLMAYTFLLDVDPLPPVSPPAMVWISPKGTLS